MGNGGAWGGGRRELQRRLGTGNNHFCLKKKKNLLPPKDATFQGKQIFAESFQRRDLRAARLACAVGLWELLFLLKKQFFFHFFSPLRWGVQIAGSAPSDSAWWSRTVCVGSTSVPAVYLRHGFWRQGLKPVPDIRGPLPERPAVGCVTSAWGWSGSLRELASSSLGWDIF